MHDIFNELLTMTYREKTTQEMRFRLGLVL